MAKRGIVTADDKKAFLLRINAELRRELETWAQDELRSLNGQIEYLLRQAVQKRKGTARPARPEAADEET
jgi:hypothetical protein